MHLLPWSEKILHTEQKEKGEDATVNSNKLTLDLSQYLICMENVSKHSYYSVRLFWKWRILQTLFYELSCKKKNNKQTVPVYYSIQYCNVFTQSWKNVLLLSALCISSCSSNWMSELLCTEWCMYVCVWHYEAVFEGGWQSSTHCITKENKCKS